VARRQLVHRLRQQLKVLRPARQPGDRPLQPKNDAMNDEPKIPPRTGQGMDYGEQADVQQVHAAVQREKREPRVGAEPLSMWLIAIYGLAIFFGGAYLGRYSGNFINGGLDPMGAPPAPKKAVAGGPGGGEQAAELSPHDRGKKVFTANCQTCHQANGLGVPGQYPPLAGSEFTNGGSRRMAMIVLKGLQGPVTVKGQQYGTAVMQPWDKTLTDKQIADVMTYERSEWGNTATPVIPEQIAALRKELANHPESFAEHDILAAPDEDIPGGAPAAGGAPPKPGEAAKQAPPKP
jgi:mono/diheme cytochrome c family protein